MIPFKVDFRPGVPLHEQAVYAAKKAMVSGRLRPGDEFPSVRALSRELRINPNTAHKVVSRLAGEGLLETRPGMGTVVARLPESSARERAELLENEIEQLVVEAKRLGIALADMLASVSAHWERLRAPEKPSRAGKQAGKGAADER